MAFGSFLSGLIGDSFGSDFTGGLLGADYLKDYKHASKTFLGDGYANVPQFKFLFHVYFTLNTGEINGLDKVMGNAHDNTTIGMMVKTAQLPTYEVEINEHNQYNRKRYVQTGIKYNPVSIEFHDDGSDLIRSMWYNYMTYYYSDSRHAYDGRSTGEDNSKFNFNKRDIYDNLRNVNDWGFNGDNQDGSYKPNFFKDIKIYGLNRGNFVQYTLVNPIIKSWEHDTFDYTQGAGTMTNRMTLNYEAVKYQRGKIGGRDGEVLGFGNEAHYDNEPSSLSKAGTGNTIFGQSGLLDAGSSIIEDLVPGGDGKINILGAALTAGRTAYAWKDAKIGDVLKTELKQEVGNQAQTILKSGAVAGVANSVNGFFFPNSNKDDNMPSSATTTKSNNKATSAQNKNSAVTTAKPLESNTQPTDVVSNGSLITTDKGFGKTSSGLYRQSDPLAVQTKLK